MALTASAGKPVAIGAGNAEGGGGADDGVGGGVGKGWQAIESKTTAIRQNAMNTKRKSNS